MDVEIVTLRNALALHYLQLAAGCPDSAADKNHYIQQSVIHFNAGGQIIRGSGLSFVFSGLLQQVKNMEGNYPRENYDRVLKGENSNRFTLTDKLAAHLCYVSFLLSHASPDDALTHLREALRTNPSLPAVVRTAIGMAHNMSGDFVRAQQSYQRTLELCREEEDLSPWHAAQHSAVKSDALAGLAISRYNQTRDVPSYLQGMKEAYLLNPNNPDACLHLSQHFLYLQEEGKARTLALRAFEHAVSPGQKAAAYILLGRLYQMKGATEKGGFWTKAAEYYTNASKLDPTNVMALYGLVQCDINRGDLREAIKRCNMILEKLSPNFLEAHYCSAACSLVLADLNAQGDSYAMRLNHQKNALKALTHLVEILPNDAWAWLSLAELLDVSPVASCRRAMRKGLRLHRQFGGDITPDLLNNKGVIHYCSAEMPEAVNDFSRALTGCAAGDPMAVTIKFNLARSLEEIGQNEKSVVMYNEILEEYPGYLDAHLRIATILANGGKSGEAVQYVRDIAGTIQGSTPWLMVGYLNLRRMEWVPAQKAFEKVRKDIDPKCPYAAVGLATIFYYSSVNKFRKNVDRNSKDYQRLLQHMDYSLNTFREALAWNPANAYAANGLAMHLVHQGHYLEALDWFQLIREAMPNMTDVWVNIGHTYMHLGQAQNAVTMYRNCLLKFPGHERRVEVMNYLSHAYFVLGSYAEALRISVAQVHLNPAHKPYWFNLALCRYEHARALLMQDRKTVKDVKVAIAGYESAIATFAYLHEGTSEADAHKQGYSSEKAGGFMRYAKSALERARTVYLRQAEEKEVAEQRMMAAQEDERSARLKKENEEKMRQEQSLMDEARAAEQLATEKRREVEELLRGAPGTSGSGRKRKHVTKREKEVNLPDSSSATRMQEDEDESASLAAPAASVDADQAEVTLDETTAKRMKRVLSDDDEE
mgnify:CR=1 FL=1